MGDEVRIFPLAHAWAMDRTVTVDGQVTTVPGVAALLNSMYHPQSPGSELAGPSRKLSYLSRNTPSRDVYGSTAGGVGNGGGNSTGYVGLPPLPQGSNGGAPMPSGQLRQASAAASPDESPPDDNRKDDALPVFQADATPFRRRYAIRPPHVSLPGLLRRLDVKPQLIEIWRRSSKSRTAHSISSVWSGRCITATWTCRRAAAERKTLQTERSRRRSVRPRCPAVRASPQRRSVCRSPRAGRRRSLSAIARRRTDPNR